MAVRTGGGTVLFTWRAVGFAAAVAVLFALSGLSQSLFWLAVEDDIALLLMLLVDYRLAGGPSGLAVARHVPASLSLGEDNVVRLTVRDLSGLPQTVAVKDDPPPDVPASRRELQFRLEPHQDAADTYVLHPLSRGEYRFGDLHVRRTGPLGLVARQWRVPAAERVKVLPNVAQAQRCQTLVMTGRLREAGVRISRQPGAGREFSSLREYLPDDEFRAIDWNATARRAKLISRQYEMERSREVVVALDAGRLMAGYVGELTKLDHAINAALVLAYVSQAVGDRAGMMVFAENVKTYVPPGKGSAHIHALLDAMYAVQPAPVDPSFLDAHLHLKARLRKRSLIVFFTDMDDPESARSAVSHISMLARKHLCICVAVGDPQVVQAAEVVPATAEEAFRQSVAAIVLRDRELALLQLRRAGVLVVDALPGAAAMEMVARYLELKQSGAF